MASVFRGECCRGDRDEGGAGEAGRAFGTAMAEEAAGGGEVEGGTAPAAESAAAVAVAEAEAEAEAAISRSDVCFLGTGGSGLLPRSELVSGLMSLPDLISLPDLVSLPALISLPDFDSASFGSATTAAATAAATGPDASFVGVAGSGVGLSLPRGDGGFVTAPPTSLLAGGGVLAAGGGAGVVSAARPLAPAPAMGPGRGERSLVLWLGSDGRATGATVSFATVGSTPIVSDGCVFIGDTMLGRVRGESGDVLPGAAGVVAGAAPAPAPPIATGGTLRGAATGARSGERRAGAPAAPAWVTGPGRGEGGFVAAAAEAVLPAGATAGALEGDAERGEAGGGSGVE